MKILGRSDRARSHRFSSVYAAFTACCPVASSTRFMTISGFAPLTDTERLRFRVAVCFTRAQFCPFRELFREHLELVSTSRSATPNKTDLSCQLIAERDQVGALQQPGILQTKQRSPPRHAHLDESSADSIVRARGDYWRGRAAEGGHFDEMHAQ